MDRNWQGQRSVVANGFSSTNVQSRILQPNHHCHCLSRCLHHQKEKSELGYLGTIQDYRIGRYGKTRVESLHPPWPPKQMTILFRGRYVMCLGSRSGQKVTISRSSRPSFSQQVSAKSVTVLDQLSSEQYVAWRESEACRGSKVYTNVRPYLVPWLLPRTWTGSHDVKALSSLGCM